MTSQSSVRVKLKAVTFTLHSSGSENLTKPMRDLLWTNKVPKGKRNKPAKINGVQHHEISDAVGDDYVAIVHSYYQPL